MSIILSGTTGIDAGSLPVNNTGNVGIGTNNPAFKLHVVESSIGTVAKFENTITNKSSQAGITINTNNASSSAGKGLFYDFRNENNISIGGVHCDVNTDGSSEIWFDTTPAGVRTSDRRVIAGRFTRSGDLLLTSGTGLLGYGSGAGGTVTQLTSKSTAVTLNKPSGQIIMNNAALAAGAYVGFSLNNSVLSSTDGIIITQNDNGTYIGANYDIKSVYQTNGTIIFIVKNVSGTTLSDAVRFRFDIIKGAIA